jgi:hypothetical protein
MKDPSQTKDKLILLAIAQTVASLFSKVLNTAQVVGIKLIFGESVTYLLVKKHLGVHMWN